MRQIHPAASPSHQAHAAPPPFNAGALLQPRLSAACVSAVLDEIDIGVVLCGAQCQVLLLNEAARRELDDGGVLRLEADGRLATDSPDGQQLLRRVVQQAACKGLRQLAPLRVGEQALVVAAQPLAEALPAQPVAVLLFSRRQVAPSLALEMLSGLFGLTHAERRIFTGLIDGKRVAVLAREHEVAECTVRAQVGALREKFGVRSVDDLLRMVAKMPPIASALRGARWRAATPQ